MSQFDQHRRHPAYRANLTRWAFLRDHYTGGLAYLDKGYLARHERESERNFQRRLAESRYPNYCKPINHLFTSHLWRRKPRRNLPGGLAELVHDVDRFQTSANGFMRQVTVEAGVEGHTFVLVDSTGLGRSPRTAAEEAAWGVRPYFVHLYPQQVLDWEFELTDSARFGQLNRLVIADPGQPPGYSQWRVWTPESWTVWRTDSRNGQPVRADEGENPLGLIPLVCVYNLKSGLFIGESTIEDIAPLNHALYRKTSILDEAEYWAGFPQLVIFTDEEVAEVELSQSRALQFRPGDEARFIEHSGSAVESLRTSIRDLKDDIFRIALKQLLPGTSTSGAESAAKRRLDRAEFVASLEERAINFEDAETRLWRLAALWAGQDPDEVSVEYNRRFDLESLTESLGRLFIDLGEKGFLTKQAAVDELIRHGLISEEMSFQGTAA